jgi:DNA topoisomerase I
MDRRGVTPAQHFTQPPPRYTEASLVKKLEELGIGRPSTYASILQVLQDRDYVRLEKKRFVPEDRGRLVTAFLESFFKRYVEYNFTADLENQLDDISGGRIDWKKVLHEFWQQFSTAVAGTKDLKVSDVLKALDEELGPHFFPADGTGRDPRLCPVCNAGRLSLKLGKFGAFIGCSNYPECRYTRPLAVENGSGESAADAADADGAERLLGTDPATGLPVLVRKGPWGPYIQLGNAEKGGEKPKRVSLPKGMKPGGLDLETALRMLALPRDIGKHPETGEMISAGIGRFGPYLKHGRVYKNLGPDDDVLTVGLNRAVSLLAEAKSGGRPAREPLRVLGEHPEDKAPVAIYRGRFGPYVSHGGIYATLPRTATAEDMTLEGALELLSAQKAKGGGKKTAKKTTRASAPKKAPAGKSRGTKRAAGE